MAIGIKFLSTDIAFDYGSGICLQASHLWLLASHLSTGATSLSAGVTFVFMIHIYDRPLVLYKGR